MICERLTADVVIDIALDLMEAGNISEGRTQPIGPQEYEKLAMKI